MKRVEDSLRERLAQAAIGAGSAPGPAGRLKTRIRVRRALYALTAAVGVVALGGLSVSAFDLSSRPDDSRPAPAAKQGPETNTLFVLDYDVGPDTIHGAVHVVEARDNEVEKIRSIDVGSDPDLAVSPDGSTVYSVGKHGLDTNEPYSLLTVVDARSGEILDEEPVDHWQGTSGAYLSPKMAISSDGGLVYVLVFDDDPAGDGSIEAAQVYDVATGRMLGDMISFEGCPAPRLVPTTPRELAAVCTQTNEVWFFEVSPSGTVSGPETVELPDDDAIVEDEFGTDIPVSFIAGATYAARSGDLYAVSRDGDLSVVDVAARQLVSTRTLDVPEGTLVGMAMVETSSDGNRLILGVAAPEAGITTADRIVAFNTHGWQRLTVGEIEPQHAFALSPTGNRLYGITKANRGILGFDAAANRSLGKLGEVGGMPIAIETLP